MGRAGTCGRVNEEALEPATLVVYPLRDSAEDRTAFRSKESSYANENCA